LFERLRNIAHLMRGDRELDGQLVLTPQAHTRHLHCARYQLVYGRLAHQHSSNRLDEPEEDASIGAMLA
jgi:hypothetical protein